GKTYQNHPDNRDMDPKLFYELLRNEERATTAAVNVADYTELLTPILQSGKDVLILVFSSGLSATYQSACLAAGELSEEFPDRKIMTVDTLAASLGQGLLVWHAAQLKNAGKSMEEVAQWVEENKLHLCHWFTVDDLHFLKRGGRVSAATAVLGTMLSIKPVMHVDNEGHLINMAKARGRKASMVALVDNMEKTAIDPANQMVFLSHGDCLEDAQKVADMVKERMGVKEVILNNVGPVIGAHSGPGTLALFFLGTER
ncbi:MAG: DegV family protein, partial [Oscillospiraceae bacterium]